MPYSDSSGLAAVDSGQQLVQPDETSPDLNTADQAMDEVALNELDSRATQILEKS